VNAYKKFKESLEQLYQYMNKLRTKDSWLVIFDKDFTKPWDEKIYWETQEYKGKTIHIVGC
jgi:hypothetical protein